jgi:Tfp pilus assembly protein PilZ
MIKNNIKSSTESYNYRKKKSRHLRAPIEIRIEVTKKSQAFTATTRNLAIGGVSFETMEKFKINNKINILLYIPVNKELELLKATSKVVWIKKDFGAYAVGAAFKKFAPGDQKRLRDWLLEAIKTQKEGKSYI